MANPEMVQAYQAGIPGNGKPFPDGAKAAKIQYVPKKSSEAPFNVAIPDSLKDVAFMAKDSKRFPDSRRCWSYGPRPPGVRGCDRPALAV
jgi:Cytochrome P460